MGNEPENVNNTVTVGKEFGKESTMPQELTVEEVVQVVLWEGTRRAEDVIVGYRKTAHARLDRLESMGEMTIRQAREYVLVLAAMHDCLKYLSFAIHELDSNYWVFPDCGAMRSSNESLQTAS